ncbi:uncharacterized protein [Asterias amurensis]|uniref:uncharacterized protein n=1 Tax=Asterias amurensis TaxID=7602 RepID=UPI003AB43016
MRRTGGVETQRHHERERHARQLKLVLQCAGPGSVAGTGSNQCHREGRPHGGYKGLSNQYPLSRSGFDKQEFMDNVKDSVNDQYKEEQKSRTSSPQWLPAANKEKNHTGEQPLILQHFLAANKQEQIDGVLPAPSPLVKRQSKSACIYRDDPDAFCRGNSTHQYLTATEMPGQSERLVDLTLGRPTRTSLLRVRQRTKSAPGVRPVVEIKSHLHKQQEMAAKTEDRHKSVEVPHELLPVTENHETVHQFLVGARYNRMNHHDAKCLSTRGLFVSRHDPLLCFKMTVPPRNYQPTRQKTNLRGSSSYSNLTESCESFGSSSSLNDLTASSVRDQEPLSPKSAWVAGPSGQVEEDTIRALNGVMRSSTPAPSPSPATRSRETFASSLGGIRRNKPKMKVIDGKTLSSRDDEHVTGEKDHHCCVMCKSEEPPKHYQRFAPGSHFARVRESGHVEQEEDWDHNVDHMKVQQYHLRIMGIKYGVKSGRQAPPRNNLLYTTKKQSNAELPTLKHHKKNAQNTSKNNSNEDDGVKDAEEAAISLKEEKPSSATSRISVRISTHTSVAGDEEGDEEDSVQDTPRNEDAAGEKTQDAEDRPKDVDGVISKPEEDNVEMTNILSNEQAAEEKTQDAEDTPKDVDKPVEDHLEMTNISRVTDEVVADKANDLSQVDDDTKDLKDAPDENSDFKNKEPVVVEIPRDSLEDAEEQINEDVASVNENSAEVSLKDAGQHEGGEAIKDAIATSNPDSPSN